MGSIMQTALPLPFPHRQKVVGKRVFVQLGLPLLGSCLSLSLGGASLSSSPHRFITPSSSSVQVGRGIVAVETFVGCSTALYRGRITRFERVEDRPGFSYVWDGSHYRLEFAAEETIRGDVRKTLNLHVIAGSKYYLSYLATHRVEMVLSVSPHYLATDPKQMEGIDLNRTAEANQRFGLHVLAQLEDKDPPQASLVRDLNVASDYGRMFGCDLAVVRGRDALLRRMRAFAKKHSEVMEPVLLGLPDGFFDLVSYHNAFGILALPKCPETERTLRAVQKDPSPYLRRYRSKDVVADREQFVREASQTLSRSFSK